VIQFLSFISLVISFADLLALAIRVDIYQSGEYIGQGVVSMFPGTIVVTLLYALHSF